MAESRDPYAQSPSVICKVLPQVVKGNEKVAQHRLTATMDSVA